MNGLKKTICTRGSLGFMFILGLSPVTMIRTSASLALSPCYRRATFSSQTDTVILGSSSLHRMGLEFYSGVDVSTLLYFFSNMLRIYTSYYCVQQSNTKNKAVRYVRSYHSWVCWPYHWRRGFFLRSPALENNLKSRNTVWNSINCIYLL